MSEKDRNSRWQKNELLWLLSLCGTLAGVSITVVALINTRSNRSEVDTITDDIFAICALAFLLCIYIIIWTLRSQKQLKYTVAIIDTILLTALTAMIAGSLIMVYTLL